MNVALAFPPLELLLACLALVGCALGALVNLAACQLAWRPRAVSPWSQPDPRAPARRGLDFVPVIGWFGLSREAHVHGPGFWIRPLLVELLCGGLLAGMYWWEVTQLRQPLLAANPQQLALANPNWILALHIQYLSHVLLALGMMAVSLIDIDDKYIPDSLTVAGALVGLTLAALYPWSLPEDGLWQDLAAGDLRYDFVRLTSPNDWPAALGGAPRVAALAIALGCWWLWIVGLMRRVWIARQGWSRAWIWFLAALERDPRTRPLATLGGVGSALIGAVWLWGDPPRWAGLLTSLVGVAVGGGVLWLVRIVGSAALGREAMGFGDVTLMAMIGAFVGWQAAVLTFFFSPFAALVVAIAKFLLHRDKEIPFGPFLCAAALGVLLAWRDLWPATEGVFANPGLLVAVAALCLVAMGALLAAWRRLRAKLFGQRGES